MRVLFQICWSMIVTYLHIASSRNHGEFLVFQKWNFAFFVGFKRFDGCFEVRRKDTRSGRNRLQKIWGKIKKKFSRNTTWESDAIRINFEYALMTFLPRFNTDSNSFETIYQSDHIHPRRLNFKETMEIIVTVIRCMCTNKSEIQNPIQCVSEVWFTLSTNWVDQ